MFTVKPRNTLSGRSALTVRARTAVASRFSAGPRVGPSPRPERVAAVPAVGSQSGKPKYQTGLIFRGFGGISPPDRLRSQARSSSGIRFLQNMWSTFLAPLALSRPRVPAHGVLEQGTLRRTNRHPSAPPVRAALPGLRRRWSHACWRLQRFDHATVTARAVGPRRSASVGSFLMCVFR